MSPSDQLIASFAMRREAIQHELRLVMQRYERLSSPPRWMLVPYCSDIASYERARDHAIDTGNETRAAEIQGWLDEEWRRRELVAQWDSDHDALALYLTPREQADHWKGRTLDAWRMLLARMGLAVAAAVETGVLDRGSETYVQIADRIRDVERRLDRALLREARGEPAIA